MTNASGKTWGTSGKDYIKFSAGVLFEVPIPEGKQVATFTVKGTTNYNETGYIQNVNGEEFGSDIYVIPAKGSSAVEHTVTLKTPATDKFTFMLAGTQCIVSIALGVQDKQETPEPAEAPK